MEAKTVKMIVDSEELAAIYINTTNDYFFSRGQKGSRIPMMTL